MADQLYVDEGYAALGYFAVVPGAQLPDVIERPPRVFLSDYLDLLPSENASKPKFLAVLAAVLQPLVDIQNVAPDFDIDTAVGAQLDAIGLWVGLTRRIDVPIADVYFAFDTPGIGFDEGVWFGPGASATGVTLLDDETYRLVLKIKMAANTWDGTLAGAQQVLSSIASSGTYLFVQDNFDMSITIGVSGKIPSALFVALIRQIFGWIRPAAVNIASVAVTATDGRAGFGFDSQNNFVAGFDTGAWSVDT